MIGLVLVTHGDLAREFLQVLEHIVGPQEQVETVCIHADDDTEKKRQEIIDKTARADNGKGVIVVTDMFGGTPSNLALSILEQKNVEALAGMNLPMLVKLASVRKTEKLQDAAVSARDAGRKYINAASVLLNEK